MTADRLDDPDKKHAPAASRYRLLSAHEAHELSDVLQR